MWAFNVNEMREYVENYAADAGLDVATYLAGQLELEQQGEEVGDRLHLEDVSSYMALFVASPVDRKKTGRR